MDTGKPGSQNVALPPGCFLLLLTLLLLCLPQASKAQTLQGQLVDRESGSPIEGALILLLSPELEARGGALTGGDGKFILRVPEPGPYLLRALRIGYETVTSELMEVGGEDTRGIVLESGPSPIQLPELTVEGKSRCVVRPGEELQLARAWEEASKALTVQEWTEGEEVFRFRAIQLRRTMDPGGLLVLSELHELVEGESSNPVRSLPAQELVDLGFIRPAEDGGFDYFGPDASALLSDAFLDTHCFRFRNAPGAPDLIGLSFEPIRTDRPPDVTGTLWLDRETAEPRFLEFGYDWAPWEEAYGLAKGRVEFRELPGGAWIIPRWWIRMPTMAREPPAERGDSGAIHLAGALEVGWEIMEIATLDGDPVASGAPGGLGGRIRAEGSTRLPLSGLPVGLRGTLHSTQADGSGAFSLDGVPEGGYALSSRPSVLDSLGVSLRGSDIFVRAGRSAGVDIDVPTRDRILEALCGEAPDQPGLAIVTGIVRWEDSGEPADEATVLLEWYEPGFWFFKKRRWAVAETDETGRYRACGFPTGTRVKVQASDRTLRSSVGEFNSSPGDIILMDLQVRRRIGEEP